MAIMTTIHGTSFRVGDTISVHYKIIEKEIVSGKTKKEKHEEQKERTQAFTGIVIAIKGAGDNQSFTVRHLGAGGIGVERIFPAISPWIKEVTIKKKSDIRRAKLYYLRKKTGKEVARLGEEVKPAVEPRTHVETKETRPEEKAASAVPHETAVPQSPQG